MAHLVRFRLLAALAVALAGCAASPRPYVAPALHARRPASVAVLPVVNLSGRALEAPSASTLRAVLGGPAPVEDYLRRLVADTLSARGFAVQDPRTTDGRLAERARAGSLPRVAIAGALAVDAVAEARVLDWNAGLLAVTRELGLSIEVELTRGDETLYRGATGEMVSSRGIGPAGLDFRPHVAGAVALAMRGLR